jgi:hypothetical protein
LTKTGDHFAFVFEPGEKRCVSHAHIVSGFMVKSCPSEENSAAISLATFVRPPQIRRACSTGGCVWPKRGAGGVALRRIRSNRMPGSNGESDCSSGGVNLCVIYAQQDPSFPDRHLM